MVPAEEDPDAQGTKEERPQITFGLINAMRADVLMRAQQILTSRQAEWARREVNGRWELEATARARIYPWDYGWREPEQIRSPTAVMERPSPLPVQLPPLLPSEDYMALADRVGLQTSEVMEARVSRFLATHGWPVYPYDLVVLYLEEIANRETATMFPHDPYARVVPYWAPLRPKDIDSAMLRPQDGWDEVAKPYERRVPAHALAKVADIEGTIPGALKFYVSDYAAATPDPFLLVRAGRGKWVIDVWDEPGW